MTIRELQEKNYAAMTAKGFHDEPRNVGELLMFVVSELGEAADAHQNGRFLDPELNDTLERYADGDPEVSDEWFFRMFAKDTLGDELADAVLRITDLCGMLGIDLETHILAKMRYNLSRPHKHGKAY